MCNDVKTKRQLINPFMEMPLYYSGFTPCHYALEYSAKILTTFWLRHSVLVYQFSRSYDIIHATNILHNNITKFMKGMVQ